MNDLDTVQLDEKLHLLEPIIQKIVQDEFKKLLNATSTGATTEIPMTDFWTALRQFRQQTDLTEFSEEIFVNLRDDRPN